MKNEEQATLLWIVFFFWYPEIFNIKRYDGDNKEFRGSKLDYLKGRNSYLHPRLCLEQNYESDTKKTHWKNMA